MSQSFLWPSAERITGLYSGLVMSPDRQPGALTIIPKPLVAALLEADYPALQEKSPLLHGLPSTETVFGSKSKCRLLQHREQCQGSPMPGGFIFLRFPWAVSAEAYLDSCPCVVVYFQTSKKLTLLACLAVVLFFLQIGLARRNNQVHSPTVNGGIKKKPIAEVWMLEKWQLFWVCAGTQLFYF